MAKVDPAPIREFPMGKENSLSILWVRFYSFLVDKVNSLFASDVSITASTTQIQGQQALTKTLNEVSVVANTNDTVTMQSVQEGLYCWIMNNGANNLQIFPFLGDNFQGLAVNTSIVLLPGSSLQAWGQDDDTWQYVNNVDSDGSDLAIAGDTGTGTIDLLTQTLTVAGTTNEIETVASGQTVTVGLPDNVIIGGALTVTGLLTANGGILILSDTNALTVGAGSDAKFWYDGTDARITTDLVAASDLIVDCGTNKTVELAESVWDDIQFQITSGKQPTSTAPTWATLTTNTGEYGFDVNDYIDLASNELNHGWKEGTTGNFHIHISIPDANGTGESRYAKFTVYVAYVNSSDIWTETSATDEVEIENGDGALKNYYLDLGDVSFAGLVIGTQVKTRIKRIAATGGTEYGSNVFIHQVGCHVEYDTIGSRTELVK